MLPTPLTVQVRPFPGDGALGDLLRDPDAARRAVLSATAELASAWWPVAVPALLGAVVIVLGGRHLRRRRRLRGLWDGARLITITPPPEVDAAGAAALWRNLVGLLRPSLQRALAGQPHVTFEVHWDHAAAHVQMWVPGPIPPGLVERAIEAAWPGAHTSTAHLGPTQRDTSDSRAGECQATGGTLRLARNEVLPLATGHDADPLRALFGAAAGLDPGDRACVQVLARPLAGRRIRHARRALRQLRAGRPTRPTAIALDLITDLIKAPLTTGLGAHRRPPAPGGTRVSAMDPERAAELRAAVGKIAEPCWEVLIRYVAATRVHDRDHAGRARARGRAHAIASAYALYSGRNFLARRRLRRPAAAVASRRLDRGDLLSITELAALAHLPVDPSTPGLSRAGARAVAPPPGVPSTADPAARDSAAPDRSDTAASSSTVKVLGDADMGAHRAVALSVPDARHHVHVIGATGSGKSTLMINMILGDVDAGRGVLVIDPKGDLVLDLLDRLPATAAGRVVLIDPDDAGAPPCLNPLDLAIAPRNGGFNRATVAEPGALFDAEVDVVVDNVVGIFRRIFAGFWGPRSDDLFRGACLTLLRHHQDRADLHPGCVPTLADIPRLLDDDAFRHSLTAGVRDDVLAGFWRWYEQLPVGQRAHAVGPVLNKLRAFLLRSFVRASVAAGPATLDMTGVLNGGICLVRLPKGVLGEETSHLLGSFVVARAWQAASARARAGTPRIDAGLYVDECHNFLNLPYPIEDMLAEARGYRLSMVLAHQHLGQLPRDLSEGISANARNKVIFNASPDDARDLEEHTLPTLTRHDLSHLGAFQAATRLLTGSGQAAAFTMRTRPLPPAIPGRADHIRAAARTRTSPLPTPTPSPTSNGEVRLGREPRAVLASSRHGRPDPRLRFLHPEFATPDDEAGGTGHGVDGEEAVP